MSTRYSTEEVRGIVKQIDVEAKMAGLISMDCGLVYSPGNVSNGISGTVMCYRTIHTENSRSHREFIRDADDFLPEFTHKMTRTDHARLLSATLRVFYTFRKRREEAARADKIQTEAWMEAGK